MRPTLFGSLPTQRGRGGGGDSTEEVLDPMPLDHSVFTAVHKGRLRRGVIGFKSPGALQVEKRGGGRDV